MLYDKEQRLRSDAEQSAAAPSKPESLTASAKKPSAAEPIPPHQQASYWLMDSDGSSSELRSAESFCSGLRQLIEATKSSAELSRLRWLNTPTLTRLRQVPTLVAASGRHYADILERLMAARATELASVAGPSVPLQNGAEAPQGATAVPNCDPSLQRDRDAAPSPAALEAAIASATPIAESPRLYEPFVPAPAYPLACMAERLLTTRNTSDGAHATKSEAPSVPALESMTNAPTAVSAPAGPTRRSKITSGFAIDKSALLIPSERHLRSKAHLQFVASKPCLICETLPCHAHHLTFAQPRGLSQKVSDEFTVPLCSVHHNELHAFGNEASWWRVKGVEPLGSAIALWTESAIR